MVETIKESTLTTLNTAMAYTNGKMPELTKDTGILGSNMAWEYLAMEKK